MSHFLVGRNLIGTVVLVGLTIFNVLRAIELDITHDEARVYYTFIVNGFRLAFITYSEANHTLQTFIAIATTRIFGLSLLSLRLGSLVGSIIYILACIRLSRLVTRSSVLFTLTLLALTINPLVLDFAVLARGYSLALAFFAAALAVALTTISRPSLNNSPIRECVLISCLCSLSVLSNLSFAFANTSLLIVFAAWVFFQLRKEHQPSKSWWIRSLTALIAPGALLYIVINPAIIRLDPSGLYYGSESWRAYHGNLVSLLFQYTIPIRGLHWLIYVPAFLCMFAPIFAGVTVYSRFRPTDKMWVDTRHHLNIWFFLNAVLALTVTIHSMVHAFVGGLLPLDRTGLFLISLGTLVIASSIDGLSRSFIGRFSYVGKLAFTVLVLVFIVSLRFSWVAVWKFDAGAAEVHSLVGTYSREHRIDRIGVDWYLRPALTFNSLLNPGISFPEMRDLFPGSETKAESLFVLGRRDAPTIERERLAVIYEHPISGVVVASRTE